MPTTRNTIQRELVLGAVQQLHTHPTADEIYGFLHETHPTISRATVYRNLALLAGQGKIRRVSHLNAADRFDFETRPHYHFRCEGCGKVFDVPLAHKEDLLAQIQNSGGFSFEGYEISFFGRCPACTARAHPPADTCKRRKRRPQP